jgi:hypothetical protein
MGTTTKITWYKHAVITNEPMTLEAALRLVFDELDTAKQRLLTESDGVHVGINSWFDKHGLLFGQFLTFQPGMKHSLIALDDSKKTFDVSAIAAEQKDGIAQEFLDSIAYFGVMENHVVLAQTKALDSRDFENYLNWMLKTATSIIEADDDIVLEDPAATKVRKKHARLHIRGLTIGAPVRAHLSPSTVSGNETRQVQTSTYTLHGAGANVLRSILPEGALDKLSLKSSLENDNIEVQVTIRLKGRVDASSSAEKLLRAMGRATRHMDENDYKLELQGSNGELSNSTFKVKHPHSVKTTSAGGLVDEIDFCRKMANWLQKVITEGYAEDD